MPDTPRVRFEFDRFTLDSRQRLLFAVGSATPIELPPKAFDALLYMVERPNQLLTKEDLLKALWPHVVVEENSLHQVMSLLRRVLGEKRPEHRFIVTAPGRGYRFVAAVRQKAPHDPEPVVEPAPAIDPEAHLYYLRALSYSLKPSEVAVQKAIELLRNALDREPRFARARSLLALQYTTCVMFGFPMQDALELARNEVASSLAIDDAYGPTYCAAGVVDCLSGEWCRAEERFQIAQQLTDDPVASGMRCAYLTFSVGQLKRAVQQAEHTLRLAPTHPIGVRMLAVLHDATGQEIQASRYAELATEMGLSPALAPLADVLGQLALRAGRHAEAIEHMLACLPQRVRSDTGARAVELLCRSYADPSYRERAVSALRELEVALSADEMNPPMRKRFMLWYSRIDALDEAYDLAARALDLYEAQGSIGGAWGVLWLPEMRGFRGDARFLRFARRLRLFDYWSEYGPPDGHVLVDDTLVSEGP
jgi:DNA-binding winged helix-turn-helix (wHTH) protein